MARAINCHETYAQHLSAFLYNLLGYRDTEGFSTLCFSPEDSCVNLCNMDSSMSSMAMVFTNSQSTSLYSAAWTPNSAGAYAGTCIFLIILASILRSLVALKAALERKWLARARNHRYVLVKGMTTESGKIEYEPEGKNGCLLTAQGIEENVRVVSNTSRRSQPFRLSVDIPRAVVVVAISGVGYLL